MSHNIKKESDGKTGNEPCKPECLSLGAEDATQMATTSVSSPVYENVLTEQQNTPEHQGENAINQPNWAEQVINKLQTDLAGIQSIPNLSSHKKMIRADKKVVKKFKRIVSRYKRHFENQDFHLCYAVYMELQTFAFYTLLRYTYYSDNFFNIGQNSSDGTIEAMEREQEIFFGIQLILNLCYTSLSMGVVCLSAHDNGYHQEGHRLRYSQSMYLVVVPENEDPEQVDWYRYLTPYDYMAKKCVNNLTLASCMALAKTIKYKISNTEISKDLQYFIQQVATFVAPTLQHQEFKYNKSIRFNQLHKLLRDESCFRVNLMKNEYARMMDAIEAVDAEAQALFSVDHRVNVGDISHTLTESLRNTIGNFFNHLSENLISTYNFTKTVVSGIAICLILWYALDFVVTRQTAAQNASAILLVLCIIAQVSLAKELAARIVSLLGTIIEQLKQIFVHRGEQPDGAVAAEGQSKFLNSGLIATLVIATTLLLTGRSDLNTDKIISRVSKIPALEKAGNSIFDAFSPCLEFINDECIDKIFGCKFDWNSGVDPEIESYQENVKRIVQWHSKETTMKSSVLQTLIQETELQGLRLLQSPKLKEMRSAVMAQHSIVRKIVDECGARGIHLRGQRHPPTIIYLYGGTSSGKSTILETLALKLAKSMADVDELPIHTLDRKDLIYSRAAEQEFWDGYRGQPICLFDDFCQKKDFAQVPNLELFEIIRAGNTAEYPLHMADLADKNTSYFKSKIVILTSNCAVPKIESLAAPEALLRRIDLAFHVTRADIIDGVPVTEFTPNAISFRKYKIVKGKAQYEVAPHRLSLDDIVALAAADYKKKFGFEASRKRFNAQLENSLGWQAAVLPRTEKKQTIPDKLKNLVSSIFKRHEQEEEEISEPEEIQPPTIEDPTLAVQEPQPLTSAQAEEIQEPELSDSESVVEAESQMFLGEIYSKFKPSTSSSVTVEEDEDVSDTETTLSEEYDDLLGVLMDLDEQVRRTGQMSLFTKLKRRAIQVDLAYTNWKIKMNNLYQEHKTLFQILGLGVTLAAVAGIGFLINKVFFQDKTIPSTSVSVEGETTYEPGKSKFIQRRAANKFTRTVKKVSAQGEAADAGANQLSASLATRSLYVLTVDGDVVGGCFFVVGRTLIFPRHYMNVLHNRSLNDESTISLIGHTGTFRILTKDFVKNAHELFEPVETSIGPVNPDVCHVQIPSAHPHRDISKHFVKRQNADTCDGVNVMLSGNTLQDNGKLTMWTKYCNGHKFSRFSNEVRNEQSSTLLYKHYEVDTWQYLISTQKGDCGSLLVINDPAYKDKIIGMHSMGVPSQDRGFSIPLFQEDFEDLIQSLNDPAVPSEQFNRAESQCELPFPGDFEYVQKAEHPHVSPAQSKLVKTPLHPDNDVKSDYKSYYTPALLHNVQAEKIGLEPNCGELYSPLYYRLTKCGYSAKCVEQKYLTWSKNQYLSELQNIVSVNNCPFLKSRDTFETACKGIPGYRYINSINRSSSPGYGWIPKKGFPGKQTWFGSGPEFDMMAAKPVEAAVNNILDSAKDNIRVPVVFTDNLKDEKKPKHKWYKTRVFSACPMDYYIACKIMYQGVVGLLTQHRNFTGISVGTNVYSNEWDIMVKHLTTYTDNLVAGDFEGFDSSLLTAVLWEANDILNQLCRMLPDWDPEHEKIRNVLFCDLVNSYHCAEDYIYMWTHSLPSGHYLTAIVNSIYVNLIFRYICLIVEKPDTELQARQILSTLRMVSYGDDHVVAIPPFLQEKITQNSLVKIFNQIGMTYTDETKSDREVPDFRKITDLTYLKRKFRYEPRIGRFVAPLQLDVVLESVMWQRKGQGSARNLENQIVNAVAELALHGQSVFDKHFKNIESASLRTIFWTPGVKRDRLEYIRQLEEEEEERQLL